MFGANTFRKPDLQSASDEVADRVPMKAVVYDRYGPPDVLQIAEVEQPIPKADEVLIRIRATTVSRTDTGLRSAELFVSRFFTGLRRPKRRILGSDLAGEVEAVGAAVTEFKPGDRGSDSSRGSLARMRSSSACSRALPWLSCPRACRLMR